MKTQITKMNRIIVVVLFSLALITFFLQQVSAQSLHYFRSKKATYYGGSLSLAFPQYTLKSSIAAIDKLKVSYIGANLGGVVANSFGKLKADFGLYYSNPSVPYAMQMTQSSLSGSLYVLRLNKKAPYHTFEPYTKLGLVNQRTSFYGNYKTSESNNYNSIDEPLLNTSSFNQVQVGAGIEYQLESYSDKFIHLFFEVGYSFQVSKNATNNAFVNTSPLNQTLISFGINFGIIK